MNEERRDPAFQELLAERAHRLAEKMESSERQQCLYEVALVRIGSQRLGIPADHVREIAPFTRLTQLPGLPPMLSGVTQLRGELMSVIDGAALVESDDAGAPAFSVVLQGPLGAIVLSVEAVEGFRAIHADEVVGTLEGSTRPVQATTRDLVSILDVPKVMELEGIMSR